nr:hypothetical protein [Tanacetum cinerariifolium]
MIFKGLMMVEYKRCGALMIDYLSIVMTDKVSHTKEIDIVKLVVEIKSFGMSADESDKETGSSDGLQPKKGLMMVEYKRCGALMIDYLSIVMTDKVSHTKEIDIVKLVVEIKSFGMTADESDKETGSSDGLQPK